MSLAVGMAAAKTHIGLGFFFHGCHDLDDAPQNIAVLIAPFALYLYRRAL
jgi:hypothetical protein